MAKRFTSKWRESASLIILAKDKTNQDFLCDYKVLLFNRAQKASFYPNSAVFPGGVHESSDASPLWLDHINSFRNTKDLNLFHCKKPRPNIFTSNIDQEIPRDISLRITAIRETFEETGILLCLERNNKTTISYGQIYENFDRRYWQYRVHNDHTQFLALCKELNVVPDLWSLHEWTAWLTPTTFTKRFETAFYVVAMEHMPEVLLESNEAASFMWKTPVEFVTLYFSKYLFLPPPQLYELSRLWHFTRLNELLEFAQVRSQKGITLMLPVVQQCIDGRVNLMPGDDLYPSDPTQGSSPVEPINISIKQYREMAKNLHRMEFFDNNKVIIQLNCSLADGHLPPVNIKQ
ncbi:acyl-coenzyme A diphosphatase NUDT19 [Anastrepha ludens]|uniref:acyl-coenzyme A diphosphatase NUDT19 n=1 Tax=Anastrepha ludens TaxID=28586 RepID=UPI0023B1C353|nr:acyl-coenzyme A diphosphatase NUDT19 [Anastrepha ludens]